MHSGMYLRTYLALVLGSTVTRAQSTCYDGVKIFMARGTNESQNGSILESVAQPILAAIPASSATEIIYPASYDFLDSAEAGFQNTQQQLFDYHTSCPDSKIVLMGYSQGAAVIGAVLSGGGGFEFGIQVPQAPSLCGQIAQNVIAVIQIGDPGRNLGVGQDADTAGPACNVSATTPRTGSALGYISLYASRLQEWCAAGDPVCCATGKDFSAHGSYFTNDTYTTIAAFVAEKYDKAAFPMSARYNVTDCTPVTSINGSVSTPGSVTATAAASTIASLAISSSLGSITGSASLSSGVATETSISTTHTTVPSMTSTPSSIGSKRLEMSIATACVFGMVAMLMICF